MYCIQTIEYRHAQAFYYFLYYIFPFFKTPFLLMAYLCLCLCLSGESKRWYGLGIRENLSMNIHYNLVSSPNYLEGNSIKSQSTLLLPLCQYVFSSLLSTVEMWRLDPLSLVREELFCALPFTYVFNKLSFTLPGHWNTKNVLWGEACVSIVEIEHLMSEVLVTPKSI